MRNAEIARKTAETDIRLALNLDGRGEGSIDTGCGFLDHMLTLFARHGRFDLNVSCRGDTQVDYHHTAEDTGIVLGSAFAKAIGGFSGIERYGYFSIPMDESLANVSLDLSNRPFLVFNAKMAQEICGDFETAVCEEFWRAFAMNAGITLHINVPYGNNAHHQIEAIFKAVGHALKIAVKPNEDGSTLSTKGVL